MNNKVMYGAAISFAAIVLCLFSSSSYALDTSKLTTIVQAEEHTLQARIGVALFDSHTGTTWAYRGDERFPFNSTHKAFACAALLAKVDAKVDTKPFTLDQTVAIRKEMLVQYSPITEQSLTPNTLTYSEVCDASVSYSDNTAANIVLDAIGGVTGFTAYMRSIGDRASRLDREEPELNEATPGDQRDTTTPKAIVHSLRNILLGDALSASSRAKLTQWMLDDQVADALLRATLPSTWKIADKSGAGGYGSRSIVAVLWPPAKPALVVAIYITQTKAPMQDSNQAIARIGDALQAAISQ